MYDFRLCFFFFNDTPTTEIYTLSLHDALPICPTSCECVMASMDLQRGMQALRRHPPLEVHRSEEHTSELQSRPHLVCRLLLEKKKEPHQYAKHAANPGRVNRNILKPNQAGQSR